MKTWSPTGGWKRSTRSFHITIGKTWKVWEYLFENKDLLGHGYTPSYINCCVIIRWWCRNVGKHRKRGENWTHIWNWWQACCVLLNPCYWYIFEILMLIILILIYWQIGFSVFCCVLMPIAAKSLLLANRLLQKNPHKSICHSTTLEGWK